MDLPSLVLRVEPHALPSLRGLKCMEDDYRRTEDGIAGEWRRA
jgi:hypothetical protein